MRKWLLVLVLAAFSGCSFTSKPAALVSSMSALPVDPIAYIQNNEVWVAASDGSQSYQITQDGLTHFSPVWFPNTSRLVYGVISGDYYQLWSQELPQGEPVFLFATKQEPYRISISPNSQFLLYFENQNAFLFDTENRKGTRLHEGVVDAAWSPDSKSIVYTTNDNRVLLQDFTINAELSDPIVLLEQEIRKPQFIDQNSIIYEGKIDEQVTLMELDMLTLQSAPISSLRFPELGVIDIVVEPGGKRALYIRPDEVTLLSNIWLIHLTKDLPKLILTNAHTPIWSQLSDTVIYIDSSINDAGEVIPVIYTATTSGLHKTPIIENAHSVVSGANPRSNEYDL